MPTYNHQPMLARSITGFEYLPARRRLARLKYGLIVRIIDGNWKDWPPLDRSVLSIGNFDGVHRGHAAMIAEARRQADLRMTPLCVLTFEPHPARILVPDRPAQRICSRTDKARLLEQCGVDQLYVAESTPAFFEQSPEQFIQDVVRAKFCPIIIVEGQNFRFGKDRTGDTRTLTEAGGFDVVVVEPVMQQIDGQPVRVSSSLIRKTILAGDVTTAANALGRPHRISGTVGEGARRGTKLGFPTANLGDIVQLIPADSVYAGRAMVDDRTFAAAISIGSNPTFDGQSRQVEAHLLDFDGDLYGNHLVIDFVERIRGQLRFDTVDALREQIARDIDAVRSTSGIAASAGCPSMGDAK